MRRNWNHHRSIVLASCLLLSNVALAQSNQKERHPKTADPKLAIKTNNHSARHVTAHHERRTRLTLAEATQTLIANIGASVNVEKLNDMGVIIHTSGLLSPDLRYVIEWNNVRVLIQTSKHHALDSSEDGPLAFFRFKNPVHVLQTTTEAEPHFDGTPRTATDFVYKDGLILTFGSDAAVLRLANALRAFKRAAHLGFFVGSID